MAGVGVGTAAAGIPFAFDSCALLRSCVGRLVVRAARRNRLNLGLDGMVSVSTLLSLRAHLCPRVPGRIPRLELSE
jgi:hypothetical protein